MQVHYLFVLSVIFSLLCYSRTVSKVDGIENIEVHDLSEVLKESCVLGILPNSAVPNHVFHALSHAFSQEPRVKIASISNKEGDGSSIYNYIKVKERMYDSTNLSAKDLIFFPRRGIDRTCLLTPFVKPIPSGESVVTSRSVESLLYFLNTRCGTFRQLDGSLSALGRRKAEILSNLFTVPNDGLKHCDDSKIQLSAVCEYIDMPEKEEFVHKYLFRSKPMIIKDAARDWPAMKKWTNEFLVNQFGRNNVHIKLAPNGEFEGCDEAANFENFGNFKVPDSVKPHLEHDDLVVVRPATMDINFGSFMNLLDMSKTDKKYRNVSAYLEYSSIPQHMPELEEDIRELPFVSGILNRKHLNLWLSNGNTVGKLHFDPFDNLLAQITGTKEFILYEPFDNTKLYEGHIQEAILEFNKNSGKFHNKELLDSTSMVMSPVDITNPDYKRFPKFKQALAMNCTVNEGDVLYLPAFWWHEVRSLPGQSKKRNLAVNFWYEPFFKKDFPCPTCKMDVNPDYHQLLDW